jgi:uncharacterized protein YecT (DUF1311 family)
MGHVDRKLFHGRKGAGPAAVLLAVLLLVASAALDPLSAQEKTAHGASDADCNGSTPSELGLCGQRQLDRARAADDRALAALSRAWPAAARDQLAVLRKAFAAYDGLQGSNEIDMTSDMRFVGSVEVQDSARKRFMAALRAFEAGTLPAQTETDFRAADTLLNRSYGQTLKRVDALDPDVGVTRAKVRDTERAWLRYKKAFLDLAALRRPGLPTWSLATLLTKDRTAFLDDVPLTWDNVPFQNQ